MKVTARLQQDWQTEGRYWVWKIEQKASNSLMMLDVYRSNCYLLYSALKCFEKQWEFWFAADKMRTKDAISYLYWGKIVS